LKYATPYRNLWQGYFNVEVSESSPIKKVRQIFFIYVHLWKGQRTREEIHLGGCLIAYVVMHQEICALDLAQNRFVTQSYPSFFLMCVRGKEKAGYKGFFKKDPSI
jgi:hypothetical protein